MKAAKILTRQDLQDILSGAALLGAGGGGPVWMGQQIIDQLLENSVRLISPEDVADDAMMAVASFFGAPALLRTQKLNYGAITQQAFDKLANLNNTQFSYALPLEVGAGNSFVPMALAAVAGDIILVDGDGARRAVPSPGASTYASVPLGNVVVANKDDKTLSMASSDLATTLSALNNALANDNSFISGSGLSLWAMSGQQMKRAIVSGSTTYALQLGAAIRKAQANQADPVQAAVEFLGGKLLFVGTVHTLDIHQDFSLSSIIFTNGSEQVTVYSKPDNMLAWSSKDPAPLVVAPDLICYMTPAGDTMSVTEVQDLYAKDPTAEIAILSAPAVSVLHEPPLKYVYSQIMRSIGYAGPQAPIAPTGDAHA